MTNADPNALAPSPSLFDARPFPDDAYSEAFSSPASPRAHWQSLLEALNAAGAATLDRRQKRVGRRRHEDGATYNPFDDAARGATPWFLESIPLVLDAAEWAVLEAGLVQRALLLEKILADIYGAQDLMTTGRIPPELVYANPNFLRTCHGVQPAGNRFLTIYAADLYRGADGRFRVLRDHGSNPAGLGYALENRIVISRVFPGLYHRAQIRRLAPFFSTFHNSLIQRASLRREDPGIVLLSPGPDAHTYFEQALLSRYLGYPLVEGQDLTVRNGKVFLKKLAGLEPVEAILRFVADHDSDPFALRRATATGVAGLIQVCREENIDIVNPIGSGFVDTPVLAVWLPSLCRQLLGEPLALEDHPAWWCGDADGRAHVLSNAERLTVGPAMDRSAATVDPAAAATAINATPHAYMAREPVRPSVVPAWGQDGIVSRYALLRVFVCATQEGFAVMPGGLAITAADVDTLVGDLPERQESKDIWVPSNQPVEPFSLMGGLRKVAAFRRNGDLPSRVADHLLWLGRYLERAEGLIRLLRCFFRRLSGEARPGDLPELPFLLDLLRKDNLLPPAVEAGAAIPRYRELSAHLNAALFDRERPESVIAILLRVRNAARHVRDRLSLDSWRVINRLERFDDHPAADPLDLLDDTLFTLSAFSGLAMESMTRGLGWRFLDMGRRVERAANQAELLRIGLPQVCQESSSTLEALLEVFDSIMTYRARYRTTFQLAPVLDLLILDESNPKSLAFQYCQLAAHVENLPRQSDLEDAHPELTMANAMLHAVREMDLIGLHCTPESAGTTALMAFLASTERNLKDFAQLINAHYLSRVPTTPHFSTLSGGHRP
jgi:uncharacterized circularly permuted ATP-grasp superfamily protein/uncharacterized alpha-E superfamily protein